MNILPFFATMGQPAASGQPVGGASKSGATHSGGSFASLFGAKVTTSAAGLDATASTSATIIPGVVEPDTAASEGSLLLQALRKGISRLTGKQELPVQDLTLTGEELRDVRQALAGFGLSEEYIDELTTQNGGMGWVQFLQRMELALERLRERNPGVCLSCEERAQVQTLFEKLGFNASQANSLMEDVRSGDFDKVLSAVQNRLGGMDKDETISLSGAELALLGQYMRLSDADAEKLGRIVGQSGRTEFSVGEVQAAMSLLQNAVAEQKQSIGDATLNLRLNMARILDDALTRSTGEGLVDSDAKKYILAHSETQAAKSMGLKTDAAGGQKSEDTDGLLTTATKDRAEHSGQTAQGGADAAKLLAGNAGTGGKDATGDDGEASDDPWKGFWERLTRGTGEHDQSGTGGAGTATQAFAKAEAGADAAQLQAQAQPQKASYNPQDVLHQVEQGIYKTLGAGKSQLTIRLDPPELGSLHILLQVKGNELKAVVSTDNPDTTRVLSEQMAQVRQQLESQGIKISELEVQTGLPQDSLTRDWQGSFEHNRGQEQSEMDRLRQRMRNLKSAGGDLLSPLAGQGLMAGRAAGAGLDLIA